MSGDGQSKRIKVMTIVGTRPELIKLSRVIAELDRHMDHVLVHSGQNFDYELNEVFFQELGIRRPDIFLNANAETAAQTIGNVIVKADEVFEREQPNAVLIYGDTNTGLAVIPAKRRKIPVFHMEAGNRCFDQRVPEEVNRKIIDHLSDINLPLTEHARRYLLDEGLPPDRVIKSGSTMTEVLSFYRPEIDASLILDELGLAPRNYLLVSVHREENVDDPAKLRRLLACLQALADHFGRRLIVSTHPRTRKRLNALTGHHDDDRIAFLKPFGFLSYIKLQMNAFCVISDSGTITEESSILGFPAVTLREAHERPEGMDRATLILTGLDPERVVQSVKIVTDQFEPGKRPTVVVDDYDVPDVSRKMVRIIASYIDYVNRTVWSK
ncbi:non-hydrolyzing UDP-N-acetylglucosamine 2-epimerase [Rhodopseudomonas palustris]|uniref:non-hydrolyzing UDP-N-acetylglucosamine 2-epimerase n=1 Tax=Rhodopseudomonas palustris TaxID=1076 RepID=UPI000E5C3383|nr:UDP-N-acetylglucosamine 2-epimerase (non-hydrolyzing) [Rhodopseudomonas palustris]QLH73048.1 UDP-N-acetylglucosamine 2-epimerase (non-hydrolyzing) [Rhodopseudomonas palustris]RHZ91239.1 UDP-N-acetylglucosamine 2-epimerase (non-hydrolyzing) [Rhodopseudomonas palustris]